MLSQDDWQRLIDRGIIQPDTMSQVDKDAVMSLDTSHVDSLLDVKDKLTNANLEPMIAAPGAGPVAANAIGN